ncbi:carboxylesterase/lipase family protein [Sciscionella marina]|uniref:carboxylesterase/lipase family protein n=1 Tax=Sciscionella marina TaxID=508770 RepID=UPI0023E14D89|nr:carboxylesterase family protein [Sciscionella marina]
MLVWIPGGAYITAVSSDPVYDPAELCAAGIVVVSLDYRVGIEGFAQLDGAPANRGFLDQLAALEWVQRNIARFGGDPGRVTVAGQSAGAGSVAALLAVKRSRGLFRRAMTHSVPGSHVTPALAERAARAFADRLGAAPTAAALSEFDPWRLAAELTAFNTELSADRERWGRIAQAGVAVCPVLDGEVLPEPPWSALAGGRADGIELFAGHTREEFRLFSVMAGRAGTFTEQETRTALQDLAPQPGDARAYREAYPHAAAEELLEIVFSDALFRMPSVHLAEANAKAGGASFLFELSLAAPGLGGVLGACHSLDVPLAFGTLDSPTGSQVFGAAPGPGVRRVSRELRQAWVRFVTDGDPGWPAYHPDRRLTRVLDTDSRTVPYPEEESRRIWAEHFPVPFGS